MYKYICIYVYNKILICKLQSNAGEQLDGSNRIGSYQG